MGFVEITDARDGLYPSLRQTMAILQDTLPKDHFRRSSAALKVVADTIGEDVDSIYDTLVDSTYPRCELPLISGHGNFGFPPAYHEYSEIKPSDFNADLFDGYRIDDFNSPLPMPVPYALICGTLGYYESTTKIPTHNLEEVINAAIALIDNPDMGTAELLRLIKGPDLLIGGAIENPEELPEIYKTGCGQINIIVTPQNINKDFIGDAKDYCNWYGMKSRKLRLQEAIRITVSYHAIMNNGAECRLMSLKEILQESIKNLRNHNPHAHNAELKSILSAYKKLSTARMTKSAV